MRRRELLLAGLGFTLSSPMTSAAGIDGSATAAEVLEQAIQTGQIAGASLCIRRQEMEECHAFGIAESNDAMFLLASITKPLTVAGLMSLHDDGLFELDDRARRYLPELRGDGRQQITLRQLLTHTSGLPDQLPENEQLRTRHSPLAEFVERAVRTPLLFEPGSQYGYSSMAILLASEIAERLSGQALPQLLRERVFAPLKMEHTLLGTGERPLSDFVACQVEQAAPESGAGATEATDWDWNSAYWRKLGAPWGGAHGSAPDVARFLAAFLLPPAGFLARETCRWMTHNQNSPPLRARGLGFDLGPGLHGPPDTAVFGHTGSTGTLCWADPKSDTICVVLTTLPGRAAEPHPREVASHLVAGR